MINGFEQAVYAALQGNSEGFDYLYQMTFKDKYYIALKYMKNEADAQDVLQDAYVRAFSKLTTLTEPAKFPQWLGMIVSNTAKNALVKKNPMLFTDMASEDSDGNVEEFDIADESTQYQPELSYTQQETQELVRELINSLSDEQRLCVMMFHIDGYSISEIAQSLDCSENTVKSRLNYGRKNIKLKAEELQKRGVKLYSVSPVFLLMLLIRKEKHTPFVEAGANAAQNVVAAQVSARTGLQFGNVGQGMAANTGANAANMSQSVAAGTGNAGNAAVTGAKAGFLKTVAGKVTIALVSVAVVGGAVGVTVSAVNSNKEKSVIEEQVETGSVEGETGSAAETKTEAATAASGALKREDLADYLPAHVTVDTLEGILANDKPGILDLCTKIYNKHIVVPDQEITPSAKDMVFNPEIMNNILSLYSTETYTGQYDRNDMLGVGLGSKSTAKITDVIKEKDKLLIGYTVTKKSLSSNASATTEDWYCTMEKGSDGKYKITNTAKGKSPSSSNGSQNNAAYEGMNKYIGSWSYDRNSITIKAGSKPGTCTVMYDFYSNYATSSETAECTYDVATDRLVYTSKSVHDISIDIKNGETTEDVQKETNVGGYYALDEKGQLYDSSDKWSYKYKKTK